MAKPPEMFGEHPADYEKRLHREGWYDQLKLGNGYTANAQLLLGIILGGLPRDVPSYEVLEYDAVNGVAQVRSHTGNQFQITVKQTHGEP